MIELTDNQSHIIDSDGLRNLLQVKAPKAPEESPPVFTFIRKREVEISWATMVRGRPSGSIQAMREMFESSWNLQTVTQPALSALIAKSDAEKDRQMIGDLDAEQAEPSYRALPAFRAKFPVDSDGPPVAEAIAVGIVLKDGQSGRRFLLHHGAGESLDIKDFSSPAAYEKAWAKITTFEQVFSSDKEAISCYTNFDELDMRPAFIERRFKELDIMLGMANTLDSAVPDQSAAELKDLIISGADPDEVEHIYQRFLRFRMSKFDIEKELDKLVSFTADLGYFLYLTDQKNEKDDVVAARGKVCTKVERTVRWQTTYSRPAMVWRSGFLGIRYINREMVHYTQQHSKVIQEPRPIDTSSNLIAKWQDQYRASHPDAEIYVFEQSGNGFITADGVLLRSVIDRCRLDEGFRCRCVVVLPIYEHSISGQRIQIKYHIFERPMPGVSPTILPRLSLVESLSYRTAWQGTELGELVSSVNLAPGEQRTIRLVKSYEQETVVTKNTSSMFELEDKSTSDLTSEMENEFNSEQQESSTTSLSASISGGTAFVTASASASSGTSSSNREFAKNINKVAKRASKSVSSRNRQEVSTSTSSRTTISTRTESEAEVRNSNQGRTLNLMFHRLYNRFRGGLYLDGLRFEVIPSVELIAGSGVYEGLSYGLQDLRQVIDQLSSTPMPFGATDQMLQNLETLVLESVENLLGSEYAEKSDEDDVDPDDTTISIGILKFGAGLPGLNLKLKGDRQKFVESLEKRLNAAIASLQSDKAIEPIDLVVATPGLYLDAMVGNQPSTEPYSEKMREMEARMRAAEVFAKQSEGMLQRAQALRIANLSGGGNGIVLTSVDFDRRHFRSIKLGVSSSLPGDDWQLLVDQDRIEGELVSSDDNLVTVTFSDSQNWLKREDLIFSVALYNPAMGMTVEFAKLPQINV